MISLGLLAAGDPIVSVDFCNVSLGADMDGVYPRLFENWACGWLGTGFSCCGQSLGNTIGTWGMVAISILCWKLICVGVGVAKLCCIGPKFRL